MVRTNDQDIARKAIGVAIRELEGYAGSPVIDATIRALKAVDSGIDEGRHEEVARGAEIHLEAMRECAEEQRESDRLGLPTGPADLG